MSITYIEPVSSLLSIGCILLGIKQHPANWPLSISITLMNLVVYHQGALYDKWLSSGISIILSLYGWYQWVYGTARNKTYKKILLTSSTEWMMITTSSLVCVLLLSQLLIHMHSALPYQGACSIFLMMLGLWMTARKKLEAYIIWAVYNVLAIYVSYKKGYCWFASKYLITLGASIYGYYTWRAIYVANTQRKEPEST